jgi:hypothetical protein
MPEWREVPASGTSARTHLQTGEGGAGFLVLSQSGGRLDGRARPDRVRTVRLPPKSARGFAKWGVPWPAPRAVWYSAHMAEVDRLFDEALQLNSQQRSELARRLLDTLDETDDEVDGAWRAAARERLAGLRSGAAQGVPWDETRRRLLSR